MRKPLGDCGAIEERAARQRVALESVARHGAVLGIATENPEAKIPRIPRLPARRPQSEEYRDLTRPQVASSTLIEPHWQDAFGFRIACAPTASNALKLQSDTLICVYP